MFRWSCRAASSGLRAARACSQLSADSSDQLQTLLNKGASASSVAAYLRLTMRPGVCFYVRSPHEDEAHGITESAVCTLADALRCDGNSLSELVLYGGLGPAGAHALGDMLCVNETLSRLALFQSQIGEDGATALAAALAAGAPLSHLDMEYSDTGCAGAVALADALHVNTTLSRLTLTGNQLCDLRLGPGGELEGSYAPEGVRAIAAMLECNMALQSLSLCANCIADAEGVALARALSGNVTLRVLDLQHNEQLGRATWAAFEEMRMARKKNLETPRLTVTHGIAAPKQPQKRRPGGGGEQRERKSCDSVV
jgi:hypothetical protein